MGKTQYAELQSRTCFSFLTGASHPDEMIDQAVHLGLNAIGVTDRNGVYAVPKAYRAIRNLEKQLGPLKTKLIVGSELTFSDQPSLVLLARDRAAYGLLCRMITAAHADKPKGEAALTWSEFLTLMDHPGSRGLIALPETESLLTMIGAGPKASAASAMPVLPQLKALFKDRLYLPLYRFLDGHDARRTRSVLELARHYGIQPVASNFPHFHVPQRRRLQDVMTAIREGGSLQDAGRKLLPNGERYLKSPAEMVRLFEDVPQALRATLEIAESCTFSPGELRYRYPSEWIPAGETAQSYLEKETWKGAKWRFPDGIPPKIEALIRHELKLVGELDFADYFITIYEIVQFARGRSILCQGRGSAANSVVCFCLGITSVDPSKIDVLFERFISAERGEPPDIDVDFEHERREEVIQHVYEKYGRDRAGMVSAIITYRTRSAVREVSKAMGLPVGVSSSREMLKALESEPESFRRLAEEMVQELKGFPRHLSIHSGGFTLSADPIIETVPVEPARMEGRTIVQWDKEDLDAIGLLKVDLLALGMLSAIRKCIDLVNERHALPGPRGSSGSKAPPHPNPLNLALIPADDPPTYAMIQKADTVGTFQIESRAQMNMLGRLQPENFYDLVVQVAIVRPGPIQGQMVHPYLKRRRGIERVEYPHPALESILGKTLGVPLFQEQVMKMAMVLGGFTPGEADELRRAIAAWRSIGSIEKMGRKLMDGLVRNGLTQEYAARIFDQIQGFASYGFPESHAASFALLAYASCYLKCHYPAEFLCALVNSQPMGFYSVHMLVDDARRHGVKVLPIHPNLSVWDCTMEDGAVRLGWRVVRGLARHEADALMGERERGGPFKSMSDFLARVKVRSHVLHQMAMGDAFSCFGEDQRETLWKILYLQALATGESASAADGGKPKQLSLFGSGALDLEPMRQARALFGRMDSYEEIREDYATYGLSVRAHPMKVLRGRVKGIPLLTSQKAKELDSGRMITIAGMTVIRQRPSTAKGTVFATLEDETGFLDLTLWKDVYERHREVFLEHSLLQVTGILQKDRHSVSLLVKSMRPVWDHEIDVTIHQYFWM